MEITKIFKKNANIKKVSTVGWVKLNRDSGNIIFIEINDGTCANNLQIVCKSNLANFAEIKKIRIASAIKVTGEIVINNNPRTPIELQASNVKILKLADNDYPLQKKQHSFEFLRDIAHIRIRSKTMQSIMRIRSELAFQIHHFFHSQGFQWVATPIISSNDCEGAGENFTIADDKENKFFPDSTASLTVSGQLHAESYAMGLKKVYTFGPTFRAERSHTNRHLAEFWMVEPEVQFMNLKQLFTLIEKMLKTIIKKTIINCPNEFKILDNDGHLLQKLQNVINSKFVKLEYAKAIEILRQAINDGHKFEDNDIFFGKDLASEHERYLCEKKYNQPIFLYNFPIEIKAFYMKQNSDKKTVAATDLLVPGVGEIIGGSQREDNYKKLVERCQQLNIAASTLDWYLDLRKYGYCKSSGFGLGFERIVMYITGAENIKDCIPYPRTEGKLKF